MRTEKRTHALTLCLSSSLPSGPQGLGSGFLESCKFHNTLGWLGFRVPHLTYTYIYKYIALYLSICISPATACNLRHTTCTLTYSTRSRCSCCTPCFCILVSPVVAPWP